MQNPKPWREFFAVDRLREAYSFPERWRDAPSRVTANIYTYIGNYLRLALVLMLCVFFDQITRWTTPCCRPNRLLRIVAVNGFLSRSFITVAGVVRQQLGLFG
eukprot:8637311-Pyramimonas_sp.AAC.3